jgi:ketosteroid isomerase-like protein
MAAAGAILVVMPGGHIEIVRRACQAWCDGDISVYREMYAPDVVAEAGGLWPEDKGSVRGVDAVIANFESLIRAFERSELIPKRFYEADDALVVELIWRGVLAGSDTPIEQRLACAYRFRGQLIVHTAWYADLSEALESVGLGGLAGTLSEKAEGGATG